MRPYVIRQGDYLSKLAFTMGFDAAIVWNASENRAIRDARPNPEILCPGDILFVPDDAAPGLAVATGGTNRYVAEIPTVVVDVTFGRDGKPLAHAPYVVEGLDQPLEGMTGPDGRVEVKVPITVREIGVFFVDDNIVYPVRIGDMDPIEEISGVRMRLAHLGYYGWCLDPSPRDISFDEDDPAHTHALIAFQTRQGLTATGVIDADTRDALRSVHDVRTQGV